MIVSNSLSYGSLGGIELATVHASISFASHGLGMGESRTLIDSQN
jgi:hypothetical protein